MLPEKSIQCSGSSCSKMLSSSGTSNNSSAALGSFARPYLINEFSELLSIVDSR